MKFNRFRRNLSPPSNNPEQNQYEQPNEEYQDQEYNQEYQQQSQHYPDEQQELNPDLLQEIQQMQREEQLRQQGIQPQEQYQQQQYQQPQQQYDQDETRDGDNPLSILDEIKAQPSPKGTYPLLIGGRPLDLHVLEDYITKISPFALKTILRYHNARTIEELKGYSGRGSLKLKGGTILLIMLALGLAAAGIFVMMYMPELMATFQGGL